MNLLHLAALNKHGQTIETFLVLGADIHAKDYTGLTPLHAAASNKNLEAYCFLIDRGADPTMQNESGRTALEEREYCGAFFFQADGCPLFRVGYQDR